MTDQQAVDRYGLLAFNLARRTGIVQDADHLLRTDLGRVPLPGRVGRRWAVCLHIEPAGGAAVRRLLYPVAVQPSASESTAMDAVRMVARTGVLLEVTDV